MPSQEDQGPGLALVAISHPAGRRALSTHRRGKSCLLRREQRDPPWCASRFQTISSLCTQGGFWSWCSPEPTLGNQVGRWAVTSVPPALTRAPDTLKHPPGEAWWRDPPLVHHLDSRLSEASSALPLPTDL